MSYCLSNGVWYKVVESDSDLITILWKVNLREYSQPTKSE